MVRSSHRPPPFTTWPPTDNQTAGTLLILTRTAFASPGWLAGVFCDRVLGLCCLLHRSALLSPVRCNLVFQRLCLACTAGAPPVELRLYAHRLEWLYAVAVCSRFSGGELGGHSATKWLHFTVLVALWFVYLTLSTLQVTAALTHYWLMRPHSIPFGGRLTGCVAARHMAR